ncbi:hypothetical protein PN466_17325 [Roseofilum reptotaenium CS-1145]|uniref:vWA-MoxR associated protein N-terminal HTH domain-containing protein n=1 Tax=Roseofilum reptotaenium AO1-A TaxID=1925591 RepID=A0A1L9QV45_9CYAN|nr:hypothetical protein [Roseofilum reptotaenium]MDB9518710.1 hypothetical protein [Roseofilum reptotaenium CS-1145]OJJ26506.1 hypothetical protein BI308_05265 [Roseofilum reptotaenium AO1-A]
MKRLLQVAEIYLYRQRNRYLTDVERQVLELCLDGQSYPKMVLETKRSQEQLKRIGSYLWKDLSVALGEPVQKKNIRGALERYVEFQENDRDRCCCRSKLRSV